MPLVRLLLVSSLFMAIGMNSRSAFAFSPNPSIVIVGRLTTTTTTSGRNLSHLPRSAAIVSASMAESMHTTLTLKPIRSLDGTVTLPGSKSLSNRCLLLAALSEGTTKVENLLESDDIRYMLEALDQLKVPVERISADTVLVTGQAGPINAPTTTTTTNTGDDDVNNDNNNNDQTVELFLGNAGTAMRPLAAALCMGKGEFVLDGVPRMRERPIADLVDGLQQLGADVTCVAETGCPPVVIHAKGRLGGGKVCLDVDIVIVVLFGCCVCSNILCILYCIYCIVIQGDTVVSL